MPTATGRAAWAGGARARVGRRPRADATSRGQRCRLPLRAVAPRLRPPAGPRSDNSRQAPRSGGEAVHTAPLEDARGDIARAVWLGTVVAMLGPLRRRALTAFTALAASVTGALAAPPVPSGGIAHAAPPGDD